MNQTDLVVEELLKDVARLSKEKAIYYSLLVQKTSECDKLRKEIDELERVKSDESETSVREREAGKTRAI